MPAGPTAVAAGAAGSIVAGGFVRRIPGFRTMTPWKVVLACTGYGLVAFWLLVAVGSANPGMALFGFGVVALALLGANGWGMRSRLPGVRSPNRWVAAGTWVGLFAALLIASMWASPQVATATPSGPRAESGPIPTSKATATQRPSPLTPTQTATPTATPAATPTATPTALPTMTPTAVPAVPAPTPPAPAPAADPYPAATAAGATAVCADGTLSFSAHRSGTCSGHGGVHWWTGIVGPPGPGAH